MSDSGTGKSVIVTGAAQWIGLACARRFAADGASVVIADVQVDKGEQAAAALRDAGRRATFVACDVGERAEVEALVETTVAAHGSLDVLVNNAAVLHQADILELDEADFDRAQLLVQLVHGAERVRFEPLKIDGSVYQIVDVPGSYQLTSASEIRGDR